MGKFYSGKFRPRNPGKYRGDADKIFYRSLWERQTFRWLDENPQVVTWQSEEKIIPYVCKTDGKYHRYFVDLMVTFINGETHLIEIKPKKQTLPPKQPSVKSRKYIFEVMTYAKNISKWEAATEYCEKHGYKFTIWTEDELKGLGIKLLTS